VRPALRQDRAASDDETNVVRRVDEDFDVHLFEQVAARRNQDAFEYDDRFWFDSARARLDAS
jgi:hypothetical protein